LNGEWSRRHFEASAELVALAPQLKCVEVFFCDGLGNTCDGVFDCID
jgi:hypothetical protein